MGGCTMKKLFLVILMALPFSLTACGDSVDKITNDMVRDAIKCETKEYDKAKCDQLTIVYKERKGKFTAEEQKEVEKRVFTKFFEEMALVKDKAKKKK